MIAPHFGVKREFPVRLPERTERWPVPPPNGEIFRSPWPIPPAKDNNVKSPWPIPSANPQDSQLPSWQVPLEQSTPSPTLKEESGLVKRFLKFLRRLI